MKSINLLDGYENDSYSLNVNDEKICIKIFCKTRSQYDGLKLFAKYHYLCSSVFMFLNIITCGRISFEYDSFYLIYRWIPGKTRFFFDNDDLYRIAIQLYRIHSYKIIDSNYEILFDDYYIHEIFEQQKRSNETNNKKCFIHGDFHPGNIIWEGKSISGIVDWDNCCIGYRQFDIANIRFDLSLYNGIEMAESFLTKYEKISGLVIDDMIMWDYNLLKIQEHRYLKWSKTNVYMGIIGEENLKRNYLKWKEHIESLL